jgi:hypothetical protein
MGIGYRISVMTMSYDYDMTQIHIRDWSGYDAKLIGLYCIHTYIQTYGILRDGLKRTRPSAVM